MSYDWVAASAFVGCTAIVTVVGKWLIFKIPALKQMRELNHEADRQKLSRKRFREAVKVNNRAGLFTNLFFFVVILPFFLTLDARPLWRLALDALAVLMMFDLFYYLTHRFLFHGKPLRTQHALHHQARTPTYIDALYVHPLETIIGLTLFLGSIPLLAVLTGGPLNAFSMAFAMLVFTQLSSINHTFVNLPYFPFKTIDMITSVHAAHHVDMDRGNYATMPMLYDRLFGTFEEPVSRSVP
jgi:sterol desaturase/sphingolipid hydroxylase (fatty acid hydroxylase superfamily)